MCPGPCSSRASSITRRAIASASSSFSGVCRIHSRATSFIEVDRARVPLTPPLLAELQRLKVVRLGLVEAAGEIVEEAQVAHGPVEGWVVGLERVPVDLHRADEEGLGLVVALPLGVEDAQLHRGGADLRVIGAEGRDATVVGAQVELLGLVIAVGGNEQVRRGSARTFRVSGWPSPSSSRRVS